MKIGIIGYGKMGQVINRLAEEKRIIVQAIIDPEHAQATAREITPESLNGVDVCIDFSNPESVVKNVKKMAECGKNIVMGTTGWLKNLEEVKQVVEANEVGFLYALNFSVGVNLFFKLIKQAAEMMNQFEDYDVYGYEMHHKNKKDAPSGTALLMGEILLEKIERKSKLVLDRPEGEIKADEISLTSVRGGNIPGTHCVGFDSLVDMIEIKHTARNRDGFGLGALVAAEWVNGKKGFFTVEDFVN